MAYTVSVARTGRPRKPAGEKFIGKHLKFPPALWQELEELVPERQRAGFIRDALANALRRVRRKPQDRSLEERERENEG